MTAAPKIVFCTTCKGRLDHLKQTLPKNMADNTGYPNCKFVVLDYGCQDGTAEYLNSVYALPIESGYLSVYRYETDSAFHVSHAKNVAARCGILEGADILVTVDADNFTGPNFAEFIANKFNAEIETKPGIFLCPDFPLIHSLPHGPTRPARGYAGRLAIRANDFIKMGGYHETFNTWYGEDIDLIARLQRVGYTMRHIDNVYLNTIPHNAEVRFKEYPHAQQYENKNEVKVIYARTETVVNFGRFGLGSVFRYCTRAAAGAVGVEWFHLGPLPTRIFGIGMHKTGTSSLHEAFQILGFDSFHWGTGEAPQMWQQMKSAGRSAMLERWYALSDMPIPLLYQKLDRAYPGSKFILTVRNDADWLVSVGRLWDYAHNPTRWVWDVYPFSNNIHSAMYGRKDFDAKVFLTRYRQHNAEVKEYFKDRPDDLLVMNVDDKSRSWPDLCGFLNVPVPSIPYPAKNITGSNGDAVVSTNTTFESWTKDACYSEDVKPMED